MHQTTHQPMYPSKHPGKAKKSVFLILSIAVFVGVFAVELASANTGVADRQEINWLTRLAKSGDSGAQLMLGLAYVNGQHGLHQDATTGLVWLKAAARNGNAYAADFVANYYAKNPSRLKDSAYWWKCAAHEGNADAEWHLGEFMMQHGKDVKAASWLRKAADLGEQQAHRDLVTLYKTDKSLHLSDADLHRGDNVVDVLAHEINSTSLKSLFAVWHVLEESATYKQSRQSLMADAKQGDPVAEYQLAMRYRNGAWAVQQDSAKAMVWLQRSAAAGNPVAIKDLMNLQQHAKDRFTAKPDAVVGGHHS